MDDIKRQERSDGYWGSSCAEPELIAGYVDGTLDSSVHETIVNHLADCASCRELAALTAEGAAALGAPVRRSVAAWRGSSRLRWIAAAVVAAALVPVWSLQRRESVPDMSPLVEAVGPRRPTEARLAGGFRHGPITGQTRSATGTQGAAPALVMAAARLEEALASRRDGPHLTAFGAAELVLGRVDSAIQALEEARRLTPDDANVWIDLSAAYLEKSRRVPTPEAQTLQARAQEAATRATQLKPSAPEGWFNLASTERARGLLSRASWQRFLELERDPDWAAEGRRLQNETEER